MRLTMQDKNEFLKAALKATDLDSLKRWVVGIVDAVDAAELASGKADATAPVPAYTEAPRNGYAAMQAERAAQLWEART